MPTCCPRAGAPAPPPTPPPPHTPSGPGCPAWPLHSWKTITGPHSRIGNGNRVQTPAEREMITQEAEETAVQRARPPRPSRRDSRRSTACPLALGSSATAPQPDARRRCRTFHSTFMGRPVFGEACLGPRLIAHHRPPAAPSSCGPRGRNALVGDLRRGLPFRWLEGVYVIRVQRDRLYKYYTRILRRCRHLQGTCTRGALPGAAIFRMARRFAGLV